MLRQETTRTRRDGVLVGRLRVGDTEAYDRVRSFLGASVELYPEIDEWWQRRVLPALLRRERICYAAVEEGRLVGLCIGKVAARSAKLCTLRVDSSVQGLGVGSQLLTHFVRDVKRIGTSQMHFTISEAVDSDCGAYFRGLGFVRRARHPKRGRAAGDELVYALSMPRPTSP